MIVLWVVDTACLVFQAGSMKLFGLGLCLSHHSPAAAAGLLLSTVWQEISIDGRRCRAADASSVMFTAAGAERGFLMSISGCSSEYIDRDTSTSTTCWQSLLSTRTQFLTSAQRDVLSGLAVPQPQPLDGQMLEARGFVGTSETNRRNRQRIVGCISGRLTSAHSTGVGSLLRTASRQDTVPEDVRATAVT